MSIQGSLALLERANALLKSHLGSVYQYLSDPEIQEVMINSPTNIWLERGGEYQKLDLELSEQSLTSAITIIGNLNAKATSSLMDCRLPGLRIAATLAPVSVHGPSMSIRRHASRTLALDDYLAAGSFDARTRLRISQAPDTDRPTSLSAGGTALVDFFKWLVQSRSTYIVSGSTSSGKTALLNALAAWIPPTERVITIEDTAELKLSVPNWVSFESNAALGIQIRDLVKHTLRYRPNRILIGEIRGAEAFDMLDAYNTGHMGSAVSFHSDSPEMSLYRLENMVRMAPEASNWPLADLRRQIAATFRFVIHASNVAGHRGPVEIMELLGANDSGYDTRSLFKKQFQFVGTAPASPIGSFLNTSTTPPAASSTLSTRSIA